MNQEPSNLPLGANIESVGREIIDCGLRVHQALGPGLLESAYETYLAYEFGRRGLNVRRQVALPIVYDGVTLDAGYRIDILVESAVIVDQSRRLGIAHSSRPIADISEAVWATPRLPHEFQRGFVQTGDKADNPLRRFLTTKDTKNTK